MAEQVAAALPLEMEALFHVPNLEIHGVTFPPAVKPPGSTKSLFLAGAGERGMDISGKFVVFTAIAIYLEKAAVPALSVKWKGKTAAELAGSRCFFDDIFTGAFDKFTRVTMILPLTGQQYSEKVAENCIQAWKAAGVYTKAEATAVEMFKEAFKAHTFTPGSSILFAHSSSGSLTIAFSENGSIPKAGNVVIHNKPLCEAILESIIGEHGVSPAAKRSMAERLASLLNGKKKQEEAAEMSEPCNVNP